VIEFYCTTCATRTPFEQPPCPDDHGDDCPERFCVHCGEALLIDPPSPAPVIHLTRTAA
jgi:hypothetical protein